MLVKMSRLPGTLTAPFARMVIPPLPPPVTWALIPVLTAKIGCVVILMAPVDVVATTPLLTDVTLVPICPPVALTKMLPLVAVALTLAPTPSALWVPPVMFTVLVPLVVVAVIASPLFDVTLLEVVTVTLPPPAVVAAIAPEPDALPPVTVPVGVTKILALFAAPLIWAVMAEKPPALMLPLGLTVMSPLVLAAALSTTIAFPAAPVLMRPVPPMLMLPVLLESARIPPAPVES